jgi:hypothetical protein
MRPTNQQPVIPSIDGRQSAIVSNRARIPNGLGLASGLLLSLGT